MTQKPEELGQLIQNILKRSKTVAVVGLSNKPQKASNDVAAYLKKHGYHIIPVNPNYSEILGEKCYPNLKEIPVSIDVVDIFRKSQDVPAVVEEAIEVGAKTIWMQSGIRHEEAAKRARSAGIEVVMDTCMKVEHMIHSVT
ncbi:MAG: CoA-binding protein [Caldithrix sp.]|nr:CoA-binding protein [Caldithrix sp.]